jgi:P-type Cu2+ transporter
MDKTGTLTRGEPEVIDVVADGLSEAELLSLAAAVEQESEHPLAHAVVRRAGRDGAAPARADRFEAVPGFGAVAIIGGRRVAVGSSRLMEREGVRLGAMEERRAELAAEGKTVVCVAVDGRPSGLLAIADAARPTSAEAVASLREAGVEVVMLTGDSEATARRVAGELGIASVVAEVLPGDKAARVSELQRGGRRVAMVCDGVNDAPALARRTSGSRSAPAPTWPSRRPTWC